MKHNYYTNKDLEKGIQVLARQMTIDNWRPDLVVGVLRGGVIPAVYLSHWFECTMMSIEWSTRDNAVGKDIDYRLVERLVRGEKILIVDDICDSGLTLDEVVTNMHRMSKEFTIAKKDRKPLDLKSACLHYNIGQDMFEPDYYHIEINKNEDPRWIIYEWENV